MSVWCLIIGRGRGGSCQCVWLILVCFIVTNCPGRWRVWPEYAGSSRMMRTSSADLTRCVDDRLQPAYTFLIFTVVINFHLASYLHTLLNTYAFSFTSRIWYISVHRRTSELFRSANPECHFVISRLFQMLSKNVSLRWLMTEWMKWWVNEFVALLSNV